MLFYSIRHLTKFLYIKPVSESMMETRMHPRSDSNQRCLTFSALGEPALPRLQLSRPLGNNIHHFDIPGEHGQLVIVAESLVEHQPLARFPTFLAPDAWDELDAWSQQGDYWEMLLPSEFATPTAGAAEAWRRTGCAAARRSADGAAPAERAALQSL